MNFKKLVKKTFEDLGYSIQKKPNAIKQTDEIDFKVTYLDIGSSNGLPWKWERYMHSENFNPILVEPDKKEAEEIKKKYPKALVIPAALGSKKSKETLNVTYFQECSSILEPNEKVLGRFPVKKWFEVVDKMDVDVYPLSHFENEFQLNPIDFVKIDVQGYEFEVLKGFDKVLDNILCIELETHLEPLYEGEKTLIEIHQFLSERGFLLRHLKSVGPFEGEVVEFDAYFIKRPSYLKSELDKRKTNFWEKVNSLPDAFFFKTVDTI